MDLKSLLRRKISRRDDITPDADVETLYRPWGVTIYRTRYGSKILDRVWTMLIETIRLHVQLQLLGSGQDPRQDEAVDLVTRGDCTSSRLTHYSIPAYEYFQIEHIIEGQMIHNFMEDAAAGLLPSGATANTGRIQASFFRQARDMPLPNPPALPGGAQYGGLWDRVMECLGSRTNAENFIILERELNRMKGDLAGGNDSIAFDRIDECASDFLYPHFVLHVMRATNAILRYHNHDNTPNINARMTNIVNLVGEQMAYGETQWSQNNPASQVALVEYWREWIRD